MNILEVIILIADILFIAAGIILFVFFLILGIIRKIRRQKNAEKTFVKAFLSLFLCLIGSVVATWVLKLGLKYKAWIHSDDKAVEEQAEDEKNLEEMLPDSDSDIIFEETEKSE